MDARSSTSVADGKLQLTDDELFQVLSARQQHGTLQPGEAKVLSRLEWIDDAAKLSDAICEASHVTLDLEHALDGVYQGVCRINRGETRAGSVQALRAMLDAPDALIAAVRALLDRVEALR